MLLTPKLPTPHQKSVVLLSLLLMPMHAYATSCVLHSSFMFASSYFLLNTTSSHRYLERIDLPLSKISAEISPMEET